MSIGHASLFSANFKVYRYRNCDNPSCVKGLKFDRTIFYACLTNHRKILAYSHYLQIYKALRRSRFTIWMIPFAVSGGHTINAINEYPTSKPTLLTVLLTTDKLFYFTSSSQKNSQSERFLCYFRKSHNQCHEWWSNK